ncbi:MAG: F0F1 ATP synthase subunit A [Candidatus Tectomicrobia bacterium]
MGVAYAATEGAAQGEELSVGDAILHHVQDTDVFDLWPLGQIKLPALHLFGIDFSITKHLVMMWVACILLVLLFKLALRRPGPVPHGITNLFEAIVVFLRDEVILPAMGEAGKRYLPYLLTVFFFILFCNLLGLLPYSATATSNVTVTAALAIMSFCMIQYGGIREHGFIHHLQNLVPPGLPTWLLPIMIPVEIMGQFTKPFALCIRLFANMTAGHIVILSFLGLIAILKSFVIAPVAVGFALFITLLELFIAFLQAYIFTMLTSLFMGMSIHPEH